MVLDNQPIITSDEQEPTVEPITYECKFTVESRGGVGGDFQRNIGGATGKLMLRATSETPEQAIAATLGPGTCEVDTTENWLPAERYHRCKYCGAFFAVLDASGDIPPHFCPNCGRRVVDA